MFPFSERSKYELTSSIAGTDSEQDAPAFKCSERIMHYSVPLRNSSLSILRATGLVLVVAVCSALMGVWWRRFGLDELCTRYTSMYCESPSHSISVYNSTPKLIIPYQQLRSLATSR
jgi:hypothetical protein